MTVVWLGLILVSWRTDSSALGKLGKEAPMEVIVADDGEHMVAHQMSKASLQ